MENNNQLPEEPSEVESSEARGNPMEEYRASIDERQTKNKELLLEHLRKMPIAQAVCDKVGVSRPTFYRWKREDPVFAKAAAEAAEEGRKFVSEMSEGQLLNLINDRNLGAIMFWLRHNDARYAAKIQITTNEAEDEELSPEQDEAVRKVLDLAETAKEEGMKQRSEKDETS